MLAPFAQTPVPQSIADTLLPGLLASALYGALGIALLIVGYFVFDLVTRRLDVQAELNKGNMAVGVVVAALLLGIAYIAAHVVH